jgi:uncharacterized protein (TIGR02145 family)
MKAKSILCLFVFLLAGIGCQKTADEIIQQQPESTPPGGILKSSPTCEVTLMAGQTIPVGTVSVEFNADGDQASIIYTITDLTWCITETHLDVQVDPENFFMTNSGNPKIGHFTFSASVPCKAIWTQVADLTTVQDWTWGSTLYIAAHGVVQSASGQESTWGEGTPFSGNNWAMYFDCTPPTWQCGDPIVDERDGQEYNTVQIGDQCWMAENMKIGTYISYLYNQTDNGLIEKYDHTLSAGGLYQWDEMMQYTTDEGAQGICPTGWHIPSHDEWTELTDFIGGMDSPNGNRLKSCRQVNSPLGGECNTTEYPRWVEDETNYGTDDFGFSALPSGYRHTQMVIRYHSHIASFWASSLDPSSPYGWAWHWNLYSWEGFIKTTPTARGLGLSVRCVKD